MTIEEEKEPQAAFDVLAQAIQEGGPALRQQLTDLLAHAQTIPGLRRRRIAEALFQARLLNEANQRREVVAQLWKHDGYEGVSAVRATEAFCERLHRAIAATGKRTNLRRVLGENSGKALNHLWHLRQLADYHAWRHEDWIDALVNLVEKYHAGSLVTAASIMRLSVILVHELASQPEP